MFGIDKIFGGGTSEEIPEDNFYDITKPEKGLDRMNQDELKASFDELTADLNDMKSRKGNSGADYDRMAYLEERTRGIKRRMDLQ